MRPSCLLLPPLAAFALLLLAPAIAACSGGGSSGGTSGSTGQGGGSTGQGGGSAGQGSTGSSTNQSGAGGGLQEGQCRTQMDCQKKGFPCAPPGTPIGCGACMNPTETCQTDGECKAQGELYICEPVRCACQGPANACAPGCMNDDACAEGQACTAAHRCEAKSCQGSAPCPTNFVCGGGSAPACSRKPCTTDSDCQGYCVLGLCYQELGVCLPPVP